MQEQTPENPKPTVSVLLPFYNSEKYLSEAINSILNQTYRDFELLLIDDGSTDNSLQIAEGFSDPRIRIIINGQNHGLVYSLNKGLELARGSLIARMDADDVSMPERFQRQVDFLEAHADIGVLGTSILRINKQGAVTRPVRFKPVSAKTSKYFMIIGCPLSHPSVMMRRQLVLDAGGYDPEFTHAEDYELWSRILLLTNICSLPDPLITYRENHPDRVSVKHRKNQQTLAIEIRRKSARQLFNRDMPVEVSRAIYGVLAKDPTLAGNHERIEAARLILDVYREITNPGRTTRDDNELRDIVGYYMVKIASQIDSISALFKLASLPDNLIPPGGLFLIVTTILRDRLLTYLVRVKRRLLK